MHVIPFQTIHILNKLRKMSLPVGNLRATAVTYLAIFVVIFLVFSIVTAIIGGFVSSGPLAVVDKRFATQDWRRYGGCLEQGRGDYNRSQEGFTGLRH